MDKILTDNGGEFSNAEMTEVSNRLNIKLFTTGAESPWQNGLCEKNHAHGHGNPQIPKSPSF